jgi:hypothetical protein
MQPRLAGRTAIALDICQDALSLKGLAHSLLGQGATIAETEERRIWCLTKLLIALPGVALHRAVQICA